MSKGFNGKKKRSRGKVFAVKVTALVTAASIVFAPIQTSAALLDGLTKGVTDTTAKVTGIVDGALKDPIGTVTGAVKDPVGTVSAVTEPILTPVGGAVSGVVETVDKVVPGGLQNPGGLPVSVEPQETGAEIKTPVGNVGVLNPGVSVNTPVANAEILNPGISVEVLPNGTGGQGGTSGLVNTTLLTNQKLTGTPSSLNSKSKKITLNYSGEGVLDLGVLEDIKVVFKMPDEFSSLLKDPKFKESLSASYDVPLVEVLGIRLLERKGSFTSEQIHIDTATNSVYMNYSDLLRLELLPKSVYNFKLEISLDELPCALDNEYTFNAYTSNAFIDVSVLESQAAALNVPVTFPDGSCSKDDDNGTTPGGNNGGNNGGGVGDQPGASTGTGTAGGGLGSLLPITNTNIANIGLVGLLVLLVGMVLKTIGFKKLAD